MRDRGLRIAALCVGGATLVLAVTGAVVRTIGPVSGQTFNISSPIVFWIAAAAAATYAIVGILLALRLLTHAVPWIFLGTGFALSGVILTWAYATVASSHRPPLDWIGTSALVNTAVLTPFGLALGVLLLHVFPDGKPVDAASRRATFLVPAAAALISLGVAITPGSVGIFTGVVNPLDPAVPLIVGRLASVLGVAAMVAFAAAGCRAVWVRYRNGDTLLREQIRWFMWAAGIGGFVVSGTIAIWTVNPDVLAGTYEGVMLSVVAAVAALVPIACAIAILRRGLYDIDRLISTTLVYGALLAVIAGGYSAGMKGLDRLLTAVTGQSSDVAAVLTTLILAISFEPLKRRLTEFAKRFEVAPEPMVSPLATPDDAWIDAVASRVMERLQTGPPALGQPDGDERTLHV